MTTPRRRIIRPAMAVDATNAAKAVKVQRLRSKLEKERFSLARWMTRLRRAFNAAEKQQRRISRLERQITKAEGE